MGVPEEEREQGTENPREKNDRKILKEIDIQVQEAQSPKQDEPKETYMETHHN